MSSLVEHAERELALLGEDTDKFPGKQILELVSVFAGQGHSGSSADHTVELFTKLSRFEPLTPLSANPDEWVDQSEKNNGNPLWQSTRAPSAFSVDEGKTFYVLQEDGSPGPTHTAGARPAFTNPATIATKTAQSGETKEN